MENKHKLGQYCIFIQGCDNVFIASIHYSGGITVGPYITDYGHHTTDSDGSYRIGPKNSYIDETGCLIIT
jgi:hypothetical protein